MMQLYITHHNLLICSLVLQVSSYLYLSLACLSYWSAECDTRQWVVGLNRGLKLVHACARDGCVLVLVDIVTYEGIDVVATDSNDQQCKFESNQYHVNNSGSSHKWLLRQSFRDSLSWWHSKMISMHMDCLFTAIALIKTVQAPYTGPPGQPAESWCTWWARARTYICTHSSEPGL